MGKGKKIGEVLRAEIVSGKYDRTRKLPSDRMLMRRFSVARATVQAAMRELLEKKLVERRPGYGTFLADLAETKAAQKFAMIVPDAYYPFYARICRGITDAAKLHGWSLLTAALGSGSMRERALRAVEFSEVCIREKVSGVFFQPLQFLRDGEKMNRGILKLFKQAGVPVVLLDSDFVVPPSRSEYDLVGVDNTGIGYALAKHVIAAGAKRIMYFSNPLPAPTSLKRGTGVGIAVAEAGLAWKKGSVFFADPTDTRAAARVFAGR
ncbi:MAG: LacI family DNA-binding transcriptional regulator, partial [Kiritimatiellae bacterium]|nr:LacI family DNA-binding transcriptional regulator [Kiritimatiellia bacterium]